MSQYTLSKWMKLIIILLGICGIGVYAVFVPVVGSNFTTAYPEFAYCFVPWLVFLLLTAIPCCIVLVLGWQIASSIKADESFTHKNAKRLKYISALALATSIYVFVGNFVFFLLNMNHPSVLITSMLLVFVGISVSVVFAVLSHLVTKAAQLQVQSDLTI